MTPHKENMRCLGFMSGLCWKARLSVKSTPATEEDQDRILCRSQLWLSKPGGWPHQGVCAQANSKGSAFSRSSGILGEPDNLV